MTNDDKKTAVPAAGFSAFRNPVKRVPSKIPISALTSPFGVPIQSHVGVGGMG